MMRLFYFPTLNGQKAGIALEEMGLDYALEIIDILNGGQNEPGFQAINPNGKIPALIDRDVQIFESAAILQYLGRKSGRFYPIDEALRARIDSWLFWQMAGLGPMSGQLNWFRRAASKPGRDPVETSMAIHRFDKETRRLFAVLEQALTGNEYLCGDYSIADMCVWPWIEKYPENGGGLSAYPHISAWHARIASRPAVKRALALGIDLIGRADEDKAPGTNGRGAADQET